MLITFAACFFPRIVFIYYVETIENPHHQSNIRVFYNITAVLILINSAADPIIYSYVNTDFRKEFNRLLNCTAFSGRNEAADTPRVNNERPQTPAKSLERLSFPEIRSAALPKRKTFLANKDLESFSKDPITCTSMKTLGNFEDPQFILGN